MDTFELSEGPASPEEKKGAGSGWSGFLLETLQTIVLAIVLYFLIDTVVARVRVDNISMQPTLEEDQFILVDKISHRFKEMRHGDIVIFHFPLNPTEDYIKRLIGLPGDTVKIAAGEVYVNGYKLNESYLADAPNYEGEWVVPEDALFVLGDNRNSSSDSHSWGFVPKANLIGRAMVVYWPIGELKILTHPDVVNAAIE